MKVSHLSCGTMCPRAAPLFYDAGVPQSERRLVCHCLLIETDRHGLVLVDTGFGSADLEGSRARVRGMFRVMNRPRIGPGERAIDQVRLFGFSPRDVRHIILTHLDFDHAGGIEDFPWADVHVLREEHAAACDRRGFIAKRRYLPSQWDAGVHWKTYEPMHGEPWFGFTAVRQLGNLPPEILMIPLRGHTLGHCGVAIRQNGGWLLHAGDAYFDYREMSPGHPQCAIGRSLYQRMMDTDRRARLENQERLRRLVCEQAGNVQVFCSHDPVEFLAAPGDPHAAELGKAA
jgi:glyoxylase-like metal-dependent hydrolase (beta-lactamase superfamily II)